MGFRSPRGVATRSRFTKKTSTELPTARVVATLVAALSSGVLPLFLVGAFQVRIAADIETGFAGIGAVLALFFITTGVCSLPAGKLVDRVGATVALRIGMTFTMLSSSFIALFATSLPRLGVGLVLCGMGTTFVDTSGSRALSRAVPRTQQGMAFGAKEASGPLAALLAGLALPGLGELFAWRSLFLFATLFAFLTAITVPKGVDRQRGVISGETVSTPVITDVPTPALSDVQEAYATGPDAHTTRHLMLLWFAAATGGTIAASAANFLVPAVQLAGGSPQFAGIVLALASIVAVGTRIGSGILSDRTTDRELQIVTVLFASGAVAAMGLALATGPFSTLSAGVVLSMPAAMILLGGGWGWTGLLFLSGVRIAPTKPALSGGVVLAGLGVGGAIGPALFGYVAENVGMTWSFLGSAPMLAIAAVTTFSLHKSRAALSTAS